MEPLRSQWIVPAPPDVASFPPRLFRSLDTGLQILFGPNNSGKTRLLNALASGTYAAEVKCLDLRDTHPTIRAFPGSNESDHWRRMESVILTWGRGQGVSLAPESVAVFYPTVLGHLPQVQHARFAQHLRESVQVEQPRQKHVVRTNRFLPSEVPVSQNLYLHRLTPGSNVLDPPEGMATALADLADSPDEGHRAQFDTIRARFRDIVGADIAVRRIGMVSYLHIDDGHAPRPLADCGDGLRDVLGLLLHIECFPSADLFVDDPGIRLHPGAQRRVLAVLEAEARKRAIWIATHDSVFVAARSAVARYAVSRSDGATQVRQVEGSEEARRAVRDVGWLPADAFVADTLLCCEGPSDKFVFMDRVTQLAKYSGVVVADLGGAGKVWGKTRSDLLRLVAVARSVVAHGRVVVLLDRDEHSNGEIEKLESELSKKGVGLYVLPRPELEEYWTMSPKLVAAILRGLAQDASTRTGEEILPPSDETVARLLGEPTLKKKASERLEELSNSHGIRWSKEMAARIAVANVDDLAPEVAAAILRDLDDAIGKAL
jgi:hypothetical protein